MLPEFGCLSKAYPNYLNLLSLQNWPGYFWLLLPGPALELHKGGFLQRFLAPLVLMLLTNCKQEINKDKSAF